MSESETDTSNAMWKALADSPFVMIKLNNDSGHAEPMTAQLDKDANGVFWFYTEKDNRIAPGGPAMAQFASKGHDLFACISGTLTPETNPAVIDAHWSNAVEAWYDGGRNDPDLLMMRFELNDAEVWNLDHAVKGWFRMLTGTKVKPGEFGEHKIVDLQPAS